MKMMKKLYKCMLISIIASSALQAQDLKQIINSSLQNNHNIKSLQLQDQSKEKTYDSVSNIYNPSVIVGANYTKLDIDQ
jgi:outer membrane protein TolC